MRIIFDVARDGLAAINAAQRELQEAQQQLASGRRVSGVGDDPLAVHGAIGERATLGGIDSYNRTGTSAAARLAAVDQVLSSMGDKLTAAQVAGLSAQGTAVDPAARAGAAAQVRGLRESLLVDVNASFHGTYLFSGTLVDRPAYALTAGSWAYQGNASQTKVEIENGRMVAITFNGQSIAQGSDPTDIFTTLDNLAVAIEAGDNTGISTGIDALERAFNRTQQALGILGADEQGLDQAALRLGALRTSTDIRRSKLEDVNLAEAATRMARADTAYRAALSAVSTAERQSLLDYLR